MQLHTNYFRHVRKATLLGIVSTLLGISLVISPAASAISVGGPSDCDNNAIIHCGAHSTAGLINTYRSDAYVQKVYSAFGITNADMTNLNGTNVAGRVTKDGNVFVDGQSRAVATNAVTGGRQNISGSTKVNANGAVFYRRPPSVSFQQQSLPAFVSMKNGQFQFAVIASCGNPVTGTPSKPPAPATPTKPTPKQPVKPAPKPAPAPTQVQMQAQSQSVNVHNSNTTNVQSPPQQPPQPQPTATTPAAEQQPAETPSKLVNTGPAGLVGTFMVASAAGTFGFRRYLARRLGSYSD